MTTAYFMAPVRGANGDESTAEERAANIEKAQMVARSIERRFPDLDLYVPHDHEEIIEELWLHGEVASEDIVWAFCQLAVKRDFGIWYDHVYSGGCREEQVAMEASDKSVARFSEWGDSAGEAIAATIAELQ